MKEQLKLTDAIPPAGTVFAIISASDLMTFLTIIFTLMKIWELIDSRLEKRRAQKNKPPTTHE